MRSIVLLLTAFVLGLVCCQRSNAAPPAAEQVATAPAKAPAPNALRPELILQSGHTSRVTTLSFSADGKLLATCSGEGGGFSLQPTIVKLWDVASGIELRTFSQGSSGVWIGFSPDGRKLAIKAADEIVKGKFAVWDIASGAELEGETIGKDYVSRAVTSDGKIAAAIGGKNVYLRDAANGHVLRTLASRTSNFHKVLFSPDSTTLATGGDRFSIRLWDLRSGVLRTLEGHTNFPHSADFSPDSRLFASGGTDRVVRVWDVASGRQIKTLAGHTGQYVKGVEFNADGKRLVSVDENGFKLWDVTTGRELATAAGNYDIDSDDIHFNPRGDLLAAATKEGVKLWSAATGQVVRVLPGHAISISFNASGNVLTANDFSTQVDLWDPASGKHIGAVQPSFKNDGGILFMHPVFSPDGNTLAVSEMDEMASTSRFYFHDAKTGKRLRTITCPKSWIGSEPFTFSADGKWILCAEDKVFDVGTGEKIDFKRDTGPAGFRQMWDLAPHRYLKQNYSNYSPNGKYEALCNFDGALELVEPRTGRKIATLIGIDEKEWLVATEDGFFDGSPAAWKQIYWRFNNDTFNYAPLEAFFNEFFRPGLLADVLAGKRPTLPEGKDLSRIDRRQPKVTLSQVAANGADRNSAGQKRRVMLAIEVEENAAAASGAQQPVASGARDVRLFRNGSLVRAWHGDVFSLAKTDGCEQLLPAAGGSRRVRCQTEIPIVAGDNQFTAYAFNEANVKSADAKLSLKGGDELSRGATLHVLAIGINEYDFKPLTLRYAVADAQGFAAEVVKQQENLRKFANVDSVLLTNEQATKHNILAKLADLARNAQPEDTAIVYFAGHGTAHDNHFYLIPHDIGYAEDRPDVDDDGLQVLLRRSISDRELETAFEKVDAAKTLLVIDACNSGQALEADEKRRGPMNSKGLAQLAYEKGMYVLTAAQSYQAAQEVSKLGHGLLTYVLVDEGLKQGLADCDPQDNDVDIREWFDYATRRLPQIQLHEMQVAQSRGARLAFADDENDLSLAMRAGQRPRAFYRCERDTAPLILAHSNISVASRSQPALEPNENSSELAASPVKAHPVTIAIADRTLMGEPLPAEIRAAWRKKLTRLHQDDATSFAPTDVVADSDWLIQVAALARTDVIYLVPMADLHNKVDDERLLMSPPGDAAVAWLKQQLGQLARLPADREITNANCAQRSFLGIFRKGPAEDLKADIVEEQNGVYHTPNSTQALIGTYGKVIEGKRMLGRLPRFEQRGVLQQLDRVRRIETVHRQGRGTGKDFLSLFGSRQAWQVVDLGAKITGGRQQDVSFEIVGVRLEQSDVINALNADADALSYFGYLEKQGEPPCVVLENLLLTNYTASQTTNVAVGVNAQTVVSSDSVNGQIQNERTTSTQLASPVIRCYQMYQVKLDQNRVVELVALNP